MSPYCLLLSASGCDPNLLKSTGLGCRSDLKSQKLVHGKMHIILQTYMYECWSSQFTVARDHSDVYRELCIIIEFSFALFLELLFDVIKNLQLIRVDQDEIIIRQGDKGDWFVSRDFFI